MCVLKNTFITDPGGSFFFKDCAALLALPLHTIYNLILKTFTYPTIWKQSVVVLSSKKVKCSEIHNYRLISKLFKNFRDLTAFISHVINPVQHDFMQNRSTVSKLGHFVYVLDLDFQKSFSSP